jgi:hypothetical protein
VAGPRAANSARARRPGRTRHPCLRATSAAPGSGHVPQAVIERERVALNPRGYRRSTRNRARSVRSGGARRRA